MTVTLDSAALRVLAPPLPARLSLTPRTTLAGRLDGAWWPRSRNLDAEFPALLDALDETWGRVTRVTVNPTHWPVIPHKVPVTGHTLHVGWFTEQDPDKVILLSRGAGRWDLLVIPPETEPAAAAQLMSAAALPGSVLTAGALLTAEAVTGGAVEARGGEDAWEAEGGACVSPFGYPMGCRSGPAPTHA
ncbi:DUF5994 family protein [Streptomyces sp. NPDC006711]|uniref:DUF5994 family protein n=1 Tax=Streptomyces sp. NPDC006711 TaxID=3364762 RepID=UPI0036A5668E